MYLMIIPIILFVILVICLPQLMIIGLFAFVGYGMCKAMNKKDIGTAIIVISIFGALSNIMQHAMPLIDKEAKEEKFDKYRNKITESVKDRVDKLEFKEKEEDDLWNKVLDKIKGDGD